MKKADIAQTTAWQSATSILITDDGTGFQPPESMEELLHAGKLGLAGMQERVQLLGGSLKLKPKIGKGTTIAIKIPAGFTV